MTERYTVRCLIPTVDGYVPLNELSDEQRHELSDRIVGNMGAAIQERVNRYPQELGKVGA